MSRAPLAYRRLVSSRLRGRPLESPEAVVGWHGAVQAQEYPSAKWAVAQRTPGTTVETVDRLLNAGLVLRTHVLRPTWHLVLPGDIRWLLKLTGPRVLATNARYLRTLELDPGLLARSASVIAGALGGGRRLTRSEIAADLARERIAATGVRLAYIVMFAELEAVICSGGIRGRQFTYALLDEMVPDGPTLDGDAALTELAERYFRSHGPALADDFSWWSGLTLTQARAGIEALGSRLVRETIDGRHYWSINSGEVAERPRPRLDLLPSYDEYTVAYRDRSHHYDASRTGSPPSAATLLGPTVAIDGQVVGTWKRVFSRGSVTVTTNLSVPLTQTQRGELVRAVARYRRFMGTAARLTPG